MLEPLIGDPDDVLWRCWVLHAKYVRILMQHSISQEELLELDRHEVAIGIPFALPRYNTQVHIYTNIRAHRCIYEHHKLFLSAETSMDRGSSSQRITLQVTSQVIY